LRLGWYVRLCVILSLWWVPIGAYCFKHSEERERTELVTSSADLCYRSVYGVPIDKFNAEWDRCYNKSKAGFEQITATDRNMWESGFGMAIALCIAGWVVAFLLYWSARFILAGKDEPAGK